MNLIIKIKNVIKAKIANIAIVKGANFANWLNVFAREKNEKNDWK